MQRIGQFTLLRTYSLQGKEIQVQQIFQVGQPVGTNHFIFQVLGGDWVWDFNKILLGHVGRLGRNFLFRKYFSTGNGWAR